jgi:hypothetical protein
VLAPEQRRPIIGELGKLSVTLEVLLEGLQRERLERGDDE